MSDIHGYLFEFEQSLSYVLKHLEEEDVKLILLGDYVHWGPSGAGVLDRIMELQEQYSPEKVIALLGNHDAWVADGDFGIEKDGPMQVASGVDPKYIDWLKTLPFYHVEGKTIFVHAGIDETAGRLWEWATDEKTYLDKYPADVGYIYDLDMKVVAGHIWTSSLADDVSFHDIYYDGASHYYIDGYVQESGVIPVLMVDTETDKYYKVCESGNWLILPYDEEY